MRMNISFEISDEQRTHRDDIFHQRTTKQMATRNDIATFLGKCIRGVLSLQSGDTDDVADAVISDINDGGWSFIGQ